MAQVRVVKVLDTGVGTWVAAPDEQVADFTTECVIGRSPDVDLVLHHEGVSRRHASVHRRGGGWVLEDLGSGNGTYVPEGDRLTAPLPLTDGSTFSLPGFMLRFTDAAAPGLAATTPSAIAVTTAAAAPVSADPDPPPSDDPYVVLVLQGGGGKAAYQVGVVEALAARGLDPDWVLGVSSGAVNAAVMAGSPPDQRLERLAALWERLRNPYAPTRRLTTVFGDALHMMTTMSALFGKKDFYERRPVHPMFAAKGTDAAMSRFSNEPLRKMLLDLVDFERVRGSRLLFENAMFAPGTAEAPVPEGMVGEDELRLTLAAAHVETGRLKYFDSRDRAVRFGPEHVMASGAMPPGSPAVKIDGAAYWDGGIVANNPLDTVVDELLWGHIAPNRPVLIVLVDLWGQGEWEPKTLAEVMLRQHEIDFMGRIEASLRDFRRRVWLTTMERKLQELGCLPAPKSVRKAIPGRPPHRTADLQRLSILHLEDGRSGPSGPYDAMDFSGVAIDARRRAGREDTDIALETVPWRVGLEADTPGGQVHRVRRGAYMGVSHTLVPLPLGEPGAAPQEPGAEAASPSGGRMPEPIRLSRLSAMPPLAAAGWSQARALLREDD